jgi:hypothetical protein
MEKRGYSAKLNGRFLDAELIYRATGFGRKPVI